jgi:glycosyltransferase involved in cell wall biosynthesis
MAPQVSVIMPAYNAGRHIAASIRSVACQTFAGWELIVADDGSTDETAEIVRALAAADERIRYVRRENGGQAAARNTGIRHARGALLAFLDADDLWLPEKLERQLRALEETGADLIYCDGYVFSDDGPPEDADGFAVVPGFARGAEMFGLLYEYNRIATLSVLVRREAVERAGLFDEDRRIQNCEDYDLWLRMALAGASFYGMTEKLMRYRRHPASTTHRESRLLAPMLEVIKKQAGAARDAAQRRVRGLYRDLIRALLAEGDMEGARARMQEFAAWDRGNLVTLCQSVVLRLAPRQYDFVSREFLYRIEWHFAGLLGRRREGRAENGAGEPDFRGDTIEDADRR